MAVKRELIVVMKGAPDELLKSLDKAKSSFAKLGSELKAIGAGLTAAITVPLVGMGAAIAKSAGDFEAGMNRVKALTGATSGEFARMKQLAIDLGASTKFSAGEAADAMAELGAAGFDVNKIIDAMPGLLDLAAAGQLDLGRATQIATDLLSQFGLSADQTGRAADVLAFAANASKSSVEELGSAMSYVGPVAKTVGMTMEETAAAVGVLSDAGIRGERAGTALRGALSALLDPGKKAIGVFKDLDINIRNADGSMRPLLDILTEMGMKTKDAGDFVKVFGREAASAAIALADAAPRVKTLTTELESAAGTSKKVADTMNQGLNASLEELGGALESLAIAIADSGLLAWLSEFVKGITAVVGGLTQTNPELLKWATIIAGALASLGPLVFAAGAFAGSLSSIASVLAGTSGLLKGFFGALAAGSGIFASLGTIVPGVATALTGLGGAISAVATGPIGLIAAAVAAMGTAFVLASRQTDDLNAAMADTKEVEELRKILSEFGVELKQQAGETWPEFAQRVRDTAKEFLGMEDAATRAQKATEEWRKRFDAGNKAIAEGTKAFTLMKIEEEKVRNGLKQLPDTVRIGTDALMQLGFSAEEAAKMVGVVKSEGEGMGDKIAEGADKAGGSTEKLTKKMQEAADAAARAKQVFDSSGWYDAITVSQETLDSIDKWRTSWNKALDEIGAGPPTLKELRKAIDELAASLPFAAEGTTALIESFTPLSATLDFAGRDLFLLEEQLKSAGITSKKVAEEGIEALRGKVALAQEAFAKNLITVEELNAVQNEYNSALAGTNKQTSAWITLGNQISTIVTDLGKGLADAFLGAKSFEEAWLSALKAVAEAIVRTIVEGALNLMLESIKGNVKEVGNLIAKFKDFFGLFGGGGKKPGVPGTPSAPDAPGGPGGGVTPGGVIPVIDTIANVVNAIASIFQAFQLARIEKDVGRMEVTTRGILNEALNLRADHWTQFNTLMEKLEQMVQILYTISGSLLDGLKIDTTGAGTTTIEFALPEELRLTLVTLNETAKLQLIEVAGINRHAFVLEGESLQQTEWLATISSQLEGILMAIGGSSTPPTSVVNMVINAGSGTDGRKIAQEIQREMEKAGLMRNGSIPAFAT